MKKFIAVLLLGLLLAVPAFGVDQLQQSGKGLKIWFDSGGPIGCPYGTIVVNGARQAATDLGCELEVYYSDWQPEKMVENFQKALAAAPDGLVVMGHPGDDAYAPLIDEAIGKGIVVTAIDTELPQLQKKHAAAGFGYAGADNYLRGKLLGQEAVLRFKLGQGDLAWVWGLKSQATRGRSTVGIIESLEAAGVKVDYYEITPEVDKDPTLGVPVFTGYVAANPKVKLVIMDHGGLTAEMENFFRAANLGPDAVYGAGFSLSPATTSAVKNGYVDLIGDDQPYMQGYFGVLQAVMTKRVGFSGFNIVTSGGFITKQNIDMVSPLAEKGLR